jgi:hypoxanthine phosphoribosyltransferase
MAGCVEVSLAAGDEALKEGTPFVRLFPERVPMPIVRGKSIDVLFSASAIARRNLELAKEISSRQFQDLLVISILKGSFIFAADLIRALHDTGLSPEVEFIFISSYGAGTVSGEVKILRDIDNSVLGRDVLLIDDILESGKTLKFTRDLMLSRGAKSVSIAVLLDKRKRRQTDLEADFVGFNCPDSFVVGYGMDVAHAFRELPFVGVVQE